jgi:hypothetical protein
MFHLILALPLELAGAEEEAEPPFLVALVPQGLSCLMRQVKQPFLLLHPTITISQTRSVKCQRGI